MAHIFFEFSRKLRSCCPKPSSKTLICTISISTKNTATSKSSNRIVPLSKDFIPVKSTRHNNKIRSLLTEGVSRDIDVMNSTINPRYHKKNIYRIMLSGFALSAPKHTLPQKDAEFDALTAEEKEIIYRDLYGAGNYSIVEDDDILKNGLSSFEQCSLSMADDDKKCYDMALKKSPNYVNDKNLRLQFLRCELFDPKLAAIRFVRYFKEKVRVWGEDKAFHKITINDFEECDQIALKQGGFIGLEEKDQFNRSIITYNRNHWDHRQTHRNSMCRLVWYMFEYLVEDVETQRNGIVAIGLTARENLREEDRKLDYMNINIARHALPIRVVAIHHLVSNRFMQFVLPYLLYLVGSEWRNRCKIHTDRNTIFQELEKYGISKKLIPKELRGDSMFIYNDWLDKRKEQER